jgi:hypothetical protein
MKQAIRTKGFCSKLPLSQEKIIMHLLKRYYMIKAFYTSSYLSKRFENGRRTTCGSATDGLGAGAGIPLYKKTGKIEFPIYDFGKELIKIPLYKNPYLMKFPI